MMGDRSGFEDLLRGTVERLAAVCDQEVVLSSHERDLVLRAGLDGVVSVLAGMLVDRRLAASMARRIYGGLVRAVWGGLGW